MFGVIRKRGLHRFNGGAVGCDFHCEISAVSICSFESFGSAYREREILKAVPAAAVIAKKLE
jgi:hypothetical protein